MTRFTFVALCALAIAGCKKKAEEGTKAQPGTEPGITAPAGSAGSAAAPSEPGSAAEPGAAGADGSAAAGAATPAKAEYKPDEIWKDTAGLSRMDLMEKFKDGATVTGTVKSIKDDPTGEYVIVFDAGDNHTVEAMLSNPAPARDKKLKAGDTVTVTKCGVANPTDTTLPLRSCDLK